MRGPAVSARGTSFPLHRPETYLLSGGVPDTRLIPNAMIARAYRRALCSSTSTGSLDYGDPRGTPRLRAAVAEMLRATRGISTHPANVMITRGSQMALDLIARALVRSGDAAAVEKIGYRPAWDALRAAGAELVPIGVDEKGLAVEELASRARAKGRPAGEPIRCIYTTPHHQYPTTVLLAPARRIALLELAARERLAIIEDDYDHEFHYEGRPVAPLASHDPAGSVVYVGTFSKILAPGLRLGFVVAAERVIEALSALRFVVDRQGDHVLENAVAELVEEGELQRHARKMRRVYKARRDALAASLEHQLKGVLKFQVPAGGMTLWASVDDRIPLEAWRARAREKGVMFSTGREFDIEGKARPFVRLAFAPYDESELGRAVQRMRAALDGI
jgi:GntR family transcriptional regulator/MocR family aminotransferase